MTTNSYMICNICRVECYSGEVETASGANGYMAIVCHACAHRKDHPGESWPTGIMDFANHAAQASKTAGRWARRLASAQQSRANVRARRVEDGSLW
jgi:hypothetical protein